MRTTPTIATLIAAAHVISLAHSEPAPARTSPATQSLDAPSAEVLFAHGRDALAARDYERACAVLAESYRLDPAPGTLLNLAACEEERGRLADAWQRFREVVDALAPGDERAPYAAERANALSRRVPRITLRLNPSSPRGARVWRDDIELGEASLGVAFPINPGAHRIRVAAPDRSDWNLELRILEGSTLDLDVSAGAPLTLKAPSHSPPRDGHVASALGYTLLGLGIAALATGAIAGGGAIANKHVINEHCAGDTCDDKGLAAAGQLRSLAMVSTLTIASGVIATGAGGYLILTSASPKASSQRQRMPLAFASWTYPF